MIQRFFIIFLLFVLYEGFYFLPEKLVVPFPGEFRFTDSFFIILPLFFIFFAQNMLRAVQRFREESLLVLGICGLMFLSPLMAEQFFGQTYMNGLLLVRHNLGWFAFFPFAVMLRDLDGVERTIRLLTILVGIYVVILLLTKYFPDMGLIHYDKRAYTKTGSLIRFGEYRLFFPYGDIPILFYCIALARFLHPPEGGTSFRRNVLEMMFILLLAYAILSTYTRALVFSTLIATAFGLFTSRRRVLKYVAVFVVFVVVCLQAMIMASDWKLPFAEDTKLGKMILQSSALPQETGRELQVSMYLTHFLKSPLTGVGNLVTRKNTEWEIGDLTTYRRYGFYNATDIGYLKIAAENGLLGIAWVIWFLSYIYRSSRQTLARAVARGNAFTAEVVARGHLYFLIYLLVSGLTLPHFVLPSGLNILALSLAIMAVTRASLNEQDIGRPPCNAA